MHEHRAPTSIRFISCLLSISLAAAQSLEKEPGHEFFKRAEVEGKKKHSTFFLVSAVLIPFLVILRQVRPMFQYQRHI